MIVLGGLHIEMAGFKVIGNRLEDSGWVEALVQAKVASAGIADSFLKLHELDCTPSYCKQLVHLAEKSLPRLGCDGCNNQQHTPSQFCHKQCLGGN